MSNPLKDKPGDNGEAAPSATAPDGRDRRGRFGPGNKFSKGNPFARRQTELRAVLLVYLTPAKMQRVVKKLYELAQYGNLEAIRLLFLYALGAPRAHEAGGPPAEADSDPEVSEKKLTP
jgi:hypothetical protein